MPLLRLLVLLACVSLSLSGYLLESGPADASVDACQWLAQWLSSCPAWLSVQRIPQAAPAVLYAIAALGLLFVVWPVFQGAFAPPPENTLALLIQRGRDLHERCRKEGEQAVAADINAWIDEVAGFLRRLGHRYVVSFGDFNGIQLFASQYDTAATLEIRQRIQRLNEFLQRFRNGDSQSA
jgi:hypothetical protein